MAGKQEDSLSVEFTISGRRKRQVIDAVEGLISGLGAGVRVGVSDHGGAAVVVTYKVSPLSDEEAAA